MSIGIILLHPDFLFVFPFEFRDLDLTSWASGLFFLCFFLFFHLFAYLIKLHKVLEFLALLGILQVNQKRNVLLISLSYNFNLRISFLLLSRNVPIVLYFLLINYLSFHCLAAILRYVLDYLINLFLLLVFLLLEIEISLRIYDFIECIS